MKHEFLYLIILFIIFAFDGLRDGYVYNIRDYNKKNTLDEHVIFNVHRFFYCLPFIFLLNPFIVMVSILCFPFFHDGVYYYTRNKLSENRLYKLKFMDQSSTTTAKISLDWESRSRIFIIGLLLCILGIIVDVYPV